MKRILLTIWHLFLTILFLFTALILLAQMNAVNISTSWFIATFIAFLISLGMIITAIGEIINLWRKNE